MRNSSKVKLEQSRLLCNTGFDRHRCRTTTETLLRPRRQGSETASPIARPHTLHQTQARTPREMPPIHHLGHSERPSSRGPQMSVAVELRMSPYRRHWPASIRRERNRLQERTLAFLLPVGPSLAGGLLFYSQPDLTIVRCFASGRRTGVLWVSRILGCRIERTSR